MLEQILAEWSRLHDWAAQHKLEDVVTGVAVSAVLAALGAFWGLRKALRAVHNRLSRVVCRECYRDVPRWFGGDVYEVTIGGMRETTKTFQCARCAGYEDAYPVLRNYLRLRLRAAGRRRIPSAMQLPEAVEREVRKADAIERERSSK